MAVIFDRKSARINAQFQLATPDCFLGNPQRVHFHLTEGFIPTKICQLGHLFAMAAQGTINISATQVDLAGWDFGFIQVARANNMSKFYAGRTRKEGSVGIQAHIPPAMPVPLLLDGNSAKDPWIRFSSAAGPFIQPTNMVDAMGDHPTACAEKIARNEKTKRDNLLFHVITEYEFWTTLCARDPAGKFQQFAHFHWIVRWDQKFVWRGKSIVKGASASLITNDPPVLGPPADPAIQALLNTPADPVALVGFNTANWNVHKNSPNRSDNDDWFNDVPPDFFIP